MSKPKSNAESCPMISVGGTVAQMKTDTSGKIDRTTGVVQKIPEAGGIVYNVTLGDSVFGMVGDGIMPCVSSSNSSNKESNDAYQSYCCVGNTAIVTSGEAKGSKGFVMSTVRGVQLYFNKEVLQKLSLADSFLVRAQGAGLQMSDFPQVVMRSLSPELFGKMNINQKADKIQVGVTKVIPAKIVAHGKGLAMSDMGGVHIVTTFPSVNKECQLEQLCLGDIVAITDFDGRHGLGVREGAVTIGVVASCESCQNGKGPIIGVLMSSMDSTIEPIDDKNATLHNYFFEQYQQGK